MSQLKKRLSYSAVFVSIALATIFWTPLWLFVAVVEILVLVSLFEFYTLAEKKQLGVHRNLGLAFGALIPAAAFFGADSLMLVLACLSLFVVNFRREFLHQAFVSTGVTLLGLVYVAWFFSHLIDLRQVPSGAQWVFYIALIVKGGDAGAYFAGKRWGRTKLIEHISPNKSVEGAVAGLFTTMILSLISGLYIPGAGVGHLLFLGLSIGIISQLGDLAESLLKRDAGIKDSGQIPGLGGILDILDSLLLTVPFVYYYVTIFIYHAV